MFFLEFRSHPLAKSLLSETIMASCAGSAGVLLVSKYLSSCGPVMQCTAGSLPPTPRGSNPTTSNRARTAAEVTLWACSPELMPAPPPARGDNPAGPRGARRGGETPLGAGGGWLRPAPPGPPGLITSEPVRLAG